MRARPSKKRVLTLASSTTAVVAVLVVGHSVWRDAEAARLVAEARARLDAPFAEAPGLDRIQASTAISLLERARGYGAEGDELRGLVHYAQALEDLQRGDLLLAEGEMEEALRFLGETADLQVLAAALSRGRMQTDEAERELASALELEPDHERALVLAADLALDADDGERAIGHLVHLAELAPDCAPVENRIGLADELLGDDEAAEEAYRRAARLDRLGHDPWVNLGRLLRARGDHEGAREAFETACERAPTNPDALLGRGLTRAATGAVALAVEDFRRAAELAPNDAEPLLALGDLQRDLGDIAEAVETYREAIDREDADAASWLKLGNALALLEEYEQAATAFRNAIERSPELAGAHNGLGASLMHTGARDEAIASLEHAFELDQSDPNPLMNLGLLFEHEGDVLAARTAWERVLVAWPGSPIATRRLARLGTRRS